MDSKDFIKLIGLLSKLDAATNKASRTDDSFHKYYNNSISQLENLPKHLKRLEQGLITAKIIQA